MSSVAAQLVPVGRASEALKCLRRVATTDLGAMVIAFAVLRLVAVAHTPLAYPDTDSYLRLSFLGNTERLWTVPLVWNLLPANDLREAAQVIAGIVAWSWLAVTVAGLVEDRWVRRIGVAVVLIIGLVPQVTGWDSTLLSESLSISLLVISIVLLLRTFVRPTPALMIGCLAAITLWTFSRQINVLMYLSLLPFALLYMWRRGVVRRHPWILVAVVLIGGWGAYAITRPSQQGLFHWNALQILEDRIAPDPAALQFFESHGLPRDPMITAERGAFPGGSSPLFEDLSVMRWVDNDFKPTYVSYLLRHLGHTIGSPLSSAAQAISNNVTSGLRARIVVPTPVTETLWGTSEGDAPFWLVVAFVCAAAAIGAGVTIRCLPVLGLLLLGALFGSILTWTLTGYNTGSGELARLFMPVAILFRVGALLTIALSADALLGSRRGPTGARAAAG